MTCSPLTVLKIPSLTPPAHGGTTGRRPITIEVSDRLFEALTVAAAQQRVTKRFLVLSALRDAGFFVETEDFLEDERRRRGSRSGYLPDHLIKWPTDQMVICCAEP